VDYLFAECSFVHGVFLMTGTGIIPEDSFSLQVGDVVEITIENIGKLTNTVETK
jgi:2-dehydro-3-deoxy-D-arabinonate dehydratase